MATVETKADFKAFRRTFTVIIRRTLYHGNSVYSYRIRLVMRNKCHGIPIFRRGSFGLHRGSYLRFGIIHLRWGSFAALYRTNLLSPVEVSGTKGSFVRLLNKYTLAHSHSSELNLELEFYDSDSLELTLKTL